MHGALYNQLLSDYFKDRKITQGNAKTTLTGFILEGVIAFPIPAYILG